MEKKYVQIHSKKTIQVTSGLQFSDYTDPDAAVPNKKNIKPTWTKGIILIREGQHWYPAVVATWNTVKSLTAAGIFTIGQYSDKCDDADVISQSTKLERGLKEIKEKSTDEVPEPRKARKLSNIAEEK